MGLVLERMPVAEFRKIHQHSEIEISVIEGGAASALFGDGRHVRRADHLAVCWGAVPHGAIRVTTGKPTGYSLHIPLAVFMAWQLPVGLVTRVLNGEWLDARPQTTPCSDLALLQHWHRLLAADDPAAREIVLLEVHARLRRLARELPATRAHDGDVVPHAHSRRVATLFEKMLGEIRARHQSALTVREIARAAGIGPDHAMHIFREVCGTTIYEYLIRCRIFTAQRLLATTDDKVTAIGQASGFPSSDCFHGAFKRICGCTPRRYRERCR